MVIERNKRSSFKSEDGSILMVVLWILVFLVLLGLGLGYSTSIDQRLVSYQRDRLMALYLAKAGYVRATAELLKDETPKLDSTLDTWAHNPEVFQEASLGEGTFTVSYPVDPTGKSEEVIYGVEDEDRKVDINTAVQAVLLGLPGMTDEIADSVLEWRAEHQRLGEGFGEVKDKPFNAVEEVWLLEGMTPEAYHHMRPFITVYTDGKVNLNSASKEVLMALKMDEDLADKILRFRRGADGQAGTEDDQVFAGLGGAEQQLNASESLSPQEAAQITNLVSQNRLKVNSSVFRIRSQGSLREGKVRRTVEGVVRRETKGADLLTLLSWREY